MRRDRTGNDARASPKRVRSVAEPVTLLSSVPSQSSTRGKRATRQTLLSCRDALPVDERQRASLRTAAAASELLAARLPPRAVIALYAAKGSELDTAPIDAWARAHDFVVAYPRIADATRLLAFHRVEPDQLAPSRFGLREPSADAPVVELAAIAAFVVPGLAFDRAGGRVGWGRGHYDATLAAVPEALAVGLAFELQVVDRVPRDPHDVLLHVVVTDVATYWTP